jgi:serine O-acetyltransferase
MPWWQALKVDLVCDGCTRFNVLARLLLAPRCQALVLMRLSHMSCGGLGPIFRRINYTLNGCDISPHARIGPGLSLPHPLGVVIGPEVTIGSGCTVAQHATLGMGATGSPVVEDGAQIGIGAVVFGGITVGRQARLAANSVLWSDVPAGMIAAGSPAKVVARWSGTDDEPEPG